MRLGCSAVFCFEDSAQLMLSHAWAEDVEDWEKARGVAGGRNDQKIHAEEINYPLVNVYIAIENGYL